jgi:hypothetical protein
MLLKQIIRELTKEDFEGDPYLAFPFHICMVAFPFKD